MILTGPLGRTVKLTLFILDDSVSSKLFSLEPVEVQLVSIKS